MVTLVLPLLALAAATAAPRDDPRESGPARDVGCGLDEVCDFALGTPPLSCQYRFRSDGGLDTLHVRVTLRDCFLDPIAGYPLEARLVPTSAASVLCTCAPDPAGSTDADGFVDLAFRAVGGRGTARVVLRFLGADGPFEHAPPGLTVDFTSPDLDASCEASRPVNVIDLAIWVSGMSAYRKASDFDCNGTVGVNDLGIWASAMRRGCP